MTEILLQRAEILIQQRRYIEAEKILKEALSTDPTDLHTLVLLAETSIQLDQTEKAAHLLDTAIGMDPGSGYLFYMKARISLLKNNYDEAETNFEQALQLDPVNADYYAFWASIKLMRKQYENALALANQALEIDPENILGLNTRSTALLKLNLHEEAFQTIEGALREDPTNAYTHANYGWNLLERGDHKKALVHFGEALKNDPDNHHAQAGMVEALKANNLIYRLFLKYAFWIGNLTANYQWGVIIGLYAGSRFLRIIANSNESLRPFINPLVTLLAIVAFSTWIITPVSNLFLRFNKYGKHLLDKKEILSSNFVAASFMVFLVGLAGLLTTGDDRFISIAAFGFAMMVPFSSMFSKTKYKHALVIYTAVMGLLGIAAITTAFNTGELFNDFTSLFGFAFIAFQFVANFLGIKKSNV